MRHQGDCKWDTHRRMRIRVFAGPNTAKAQRIAARLGLVNGSNHATRQRIVARRSLRQNQFAIIGAAGTRRERLGIGQ